MRHLVAAALFAVAPIIGAPIFLAPLAANAATVSDLGDLTTLSAIAADTLAITKTGDLTAAEKRVTDFESAWDATAGTMQPLNPAQWQSIDAAADMAIEALRAATPVQADAEQALTNLIAELDNPSGGAAAPAAPTTPSAGLAVTNADGSPLPCEVAVKTVRDKAAATAPTDKAKFDEAMGKGLDRCNADDDKRADGFFAEAYALLQ